MTLAALLATIVLLGAQMGGRVTATTTTKASGAATASTALAALPASDFVIFVDTQRLVTDTLPNFLAGDAVLLAKINAKLDRFQKETGVDTRSFDSLAIGIRFPAQSSGEMRFVAIAHGSFVASDLIEAGFAAAKSRDNISREEQVYEGKKIFILTSRRDREAAADDAANARTDAQLNARTDAQRMAVAELDGNTIAMGDLESVRATLNQSLARVDQGLVDLATRTPNAVAGFAGNVPPGMARGLGNDRFEKLAASIRQLYGSASTVGTEARTLVAARTENAEQAHDIAQAINGLKLISKLGMGSGANKAEADALSSLLKGLTVTSQDNEVELKLNVTQPEIAPLMRHF
jgi:hypothetical protein